MKKPLSILAMTAVLSGIGVLASFAETSPPQSPRSLTAARTSSVTLITGDRVEVAGDGTPRITPAAGRASMPFRVSRNKGQLRVVPGDAAALIAADRVDERLFDVTALLAHGYDDARRADLPLIVQYRPGAPRTAIAAATTVRQLPSVDGASVSVPKRNAPTWWTAVARGAGGGRALGAGLAKVWLNGHRRLTLDRSTTQIGAPAAWRAGLTGGQVRVAIIDSGIDASHPDLAGRVEASANFTGEPAGDRIGHGTHVASIVAGTGNGSDGRYRGVAPDARLLDAKVCGAEEQCPEDAILAGMEWAAATQRARVANMSLGGFDTPGIDPVEQAVNSLSARYGTLFVIAAGNAGGEGTIQSPGSADAALTVGAVDREDATADFSSRGPRTGDGALKPDIVAPGVDIVAARAANTEIGDVVDERYVTASGTSMATPHVAGAGAVLFQQHPDWTSEQVKSTLMAAARTGDGVGVFDQGAGRLDLARAITQSVAAEPASLSYGIARWPHEDDQTLSKTVTYRNTGSADVTLDLAPEVTGPDSAPAPEPLVTVNPRRVVVPAGGTGQVTVTADTRAAEVPVGRYSGRLLATGAGGVLTTPLAVEKESEHYDVEITHVGRDGGTPGEYVTFFDRIGDCGADPYCGNVAFGSEPRSTLRLPAGRYTMAEFSATAGQTDISLLMRFVLDVDRDTAVTVDARRARPVTMAVPRASARLMQWDLSVARDMQRPGTVLFYGVSGDDSTPLYTADLGGRPAGRDNAVSFLSGRFAEPGPAGDYFGSPYEYQVADATFGRLFTGLSLRPRERDFATVHARYSAVTSAAREFRTTHYGQPSNGRPELIAFPGQINSQRLLAPLPFQRTVYHQAKDLQWKSSMTQGDLETGEVDLGQFDQKPREYLPNQSYRQEWNRAVFGPQLRGPDIDHGDGKVGVVRRGDTFTAGIDLFADSVPGHIDSGQKIYPGHGRLYREGHLIGELPHAGPITADLPPQPATYRLEMKVTMPVVQVSTSVTSAWTFRSAHVDGDRTAALPLLAVRYTPELDDRNHAPPGDYQIPVEIYRQPTAGTAVIRELTVEVSHDDGRTWRAAPLTRDGARWSAAVNNPAGGTVSLRTRATDTDGNKLEQTTLRAYLVNH